jgi:hypothetical protein
MSCILRVYGTHLDPATVVADCPLSIYRTWRKGEPRRPTGPASQQMNEHGGFSIVISEVDGDRVPGQVNDAIAYLTRNAVHLEPILSHHAVENRYLDFAWWFPTGKSGSGGQFNRFPEELIALCSRLRLSLEVSVYATDIKLRE